MISLRLNSQVAMKIVKSLQKHPEEWFGCTFLRELISHLSPWEPCTPCLVKFSNGFWDPNFPPEKITVKTHMRRSLSGSWNLGIPSVSSTEKPSPELCKMRTCKKNQKDVWKNSNILQTNWQTVQFLRIMVSKCQMIWLKSGNWKSYQIPNTMPIRKKMVTSHSSFWEPTEFRIH